MVPVLRGTELLPMCGWEGRYIARPVSLVVFKDMIQVLAGDDNRGTQT